MDFDHSGYGGDLLGYGEFVVSAALEVVILLAATFAENEAV
jgi:hypothetical protein